MNETNKKVYSTKDISEMFGVKESTVREWAIKGSIPAFKIGKQWFFNDDCVADVIYKRIQETVQEEGAEHYE